MQRLEFAKKSTSKIQKTEEQVEESKNRRENERIEALINSRRMYRLESSNIFYIERSKSNIVRYCRYTFGSKGNLCSCEDFKFRGQMRNCYHLDMIPIGIMKGKIIDVSTLPKEVKRDNMVSKSKSYKDDEYSF